MNLNLKSMAAAVEKLLNKADAEFKEQLESLKATVNGTLTQLQADLATAQASIASLSTAKEELETQLQALTANLSDKNKELLAVNDWLTDACLNGKLLDLKLADDATAEQKREAALKIPLADKQKAYQGALNSAFAKAGLPVSTLPTPPAGAALAQAHAGAKRMKMEAFRALSPKEQSDFCALVRKGEAVLEMD